MGREEVLSKGGEVERDVSGEELAGESCLDAVGDVVRP